VVVPDDLDVTKGVGEEVMEEEEGVIMLDHQEPSARWKRDLGEVEQTVFQSRSVVRCVRHCLSSSV